MGARNGKKMVAGVAVLAALAIVVSPAQAQGKCGGGPTVELGKLVGKEPDRSKPVKVFILAGQSNMLGPASVTTFDYIGDDPATAPLLKQMRNPDGTPKGGRY